jgi:predicted secreted hydrolase
MIRRLIFAIVFASSLASAEFKAVSEGTALSFPTDHGSHSDYQTEWWYLTGHLGSCDGSDFITKTLYGFQLTFFRRGRELAGRHVDGYLAHAALTNVSEGSFHHESRSAAVGAKLAGAASERLDLWNHEWFMRRQGDQLVAELSLAEAGTLRLIAPLLDPVLQGKAGYSRKGSCTNCASFYYSMPRLSLKAELIAENGQARELCGIGWFDHEWMSNALKVDQVGWDWASLMCKDGSNVMAFTVRGAEQYSAWSLNGRKGEAKGSVFESIREWTSPNTAKYPIWSSLNLPGASYTLIPLLENQEIVSNGKDGISYWEGAVRTDNGCVGYLELTGYKDKPKI